MKEKYEIASASLGYSLAMTTSLSRQGIRRGQMPKQSLLVLRPGFLFVAVLTQFLFALVFIHFLFTLLAGPRHSNLRYEIQMVSGPNYGPGTLPAGRQAFGFLLRDDFI